MFNNKNNITNLGRNFPLSNFSLDYLYKMSLSKVEDSSTGPAFYINDAGELVTVPAWSQLYFDGWYWNIGSWKQMCDKPYDMGKLNSGYYTSIGYTGVKKGSFAEVALYGNSSMWNRIFFYQSTLGGNPVGKQYGFVGYNLGSSGLFSLILRNNTSGNILVAYTNSTHIWTYLQKDAGALTILKDYAHPAGFRVCMFSMQWNNPSGSLTIGAGTYTADVTKNVLLYFSHVGELGYIFPFIGPGLTTIASRAGTISAPILSGGKLESLLNGSKDFKLTFKLIPYFNYSGLPVSTTKSILHSGTQSILQFRTDASGNGYIDLLDGTNTASIALDWEYGTEYNIQVNIDTAQMQLIVDSTASSVTTCDGSFDPDTELTIGLNNDYMFKITPPVFDKLKQSDWE